MIQQSTLDLISRSWADWSNWANERADLFSVKHLIEMRYKKNLTDNIILDQIPSHRSRNSRLRLWPQGGPSPLTASVESRPGNRPLLH